MLFSRPGPKPFINVAIWAQKKCNVLPRSEKVHFFAKIRISAKLADFREKAVSHQNIGF